MSENNASPFSPDSIAATLAQLPTRLLISDKRVAEIEAMVAETRETLDSMEINASLNATCTGKDAETRKLERERAITQDLDVRAARKTLADAKMTLDIESAENKQMTRQFAAYCHIAEIKAAQMLLMSKGVTQ